MTTLTESDVEQAALDCLSALGQAGGYRGETWRLLQIETRRNLGGNRIMAMKRAFISFDFDHDEELRDALKGQSRNPDSPFEIADWSLQEALTGNWKAKVRDRIRRTDLTIVICGEHTHDATGVAAELTITQEERKPYFLLKGHPNKTCTKPRMARSSDKIYNWTWENLRKLIAGQR